MRILFTFMCVLALGVMGCSETDGTGGSGGSAGSAGMGGDGGSGGTNLAGCDLALCESIDCDDADPCTKDVCNVTDGICSHVAACDDFNDCTTQMCNPADGEACSAPTAVADGTACAGGTCQDGACALTGSVLPCTEQGIRNAIAAGDGAYTFACDGVTPVVTLEEIVIDNDVILDGEGKLTVDGNCDHVVLSVAEGATSELRGVTVIRGGLLIWDDVIIESGPSIENRGTMTLANSTVSGTYAGAIDSKGILTITNSTVSGGDFPAYGIENEGTLTVTDSSLSEIGHSGGTCTTANSTVSGIVNRGTMRITGSALLVVTNEGTMTVTDSTVTGKDGFIINDGILTMTNCSVSGMEYVQDGGIFNRSTLTMTNCTVSGNQTFEQSIVFNTGELTMTNCTVSGNSYQAEEGGDLMSGGGTLTLSNSLVDGNCLTESGGMIASNGYNIESPGDTCGFDHGTDLVNITEGQLDLGDLANNGGPTMTHALGADSVAIDHIPAVDCEVNTDQRGLRRPAGTTDPKRCDVGAFEVQP